MGVFSSFSSSSLVFASRSVSSSSSGFFFLLYLLSLTLSLSLRFLGLWVMQGFFVSVSSYVLPSFVLALVLDGIEEGGEGQEADVSTLQPLQLTSRLAGVSVASVGEILILFTFWLMKLIKFVVCQGR